MAFIDIKNLHYSYKIGNRDIPVLNGISLSVQKGEMVAIQGPSGSGKSTLFYLLGCMLKPKKGTLKLAGHDLSKLTNDEAAQLRNRKIGFVFQQFHLLPKSDILENILLPTFYSDSENKGNFRQKGLDLAKRLGIETRLSHLPSQLSGGQQQRVALARALIKDADLILADEPTGNLDSTSSNQIMELLKELNRAGKTVLIITHDPNIAKECNRIFLLKDGKFESPATKNEKESDTKRTKTGIEKLSVFPKNQDFSYLLKMSLLNLIRNKTRSLLTMLGITIGVAALLAMITIGQFTKHKILDSYAELGVNTIVFRGHPNWRLKATDIPPTMFRFFSSDTDIEPLYRVFPEVEMISPLLRNWSNKVSFGGKTLDGSTLLGVGRDALDITERKILTGRNFSPFHIERKNAVCLVGFEVASTLFSNINPINQILHFFQDQTSFGCKIIGVLQPRSSNKEWNSPDLQVIVPYTFFQAVSDNWWQAQIKRLLIRLKPGSDVEMTGKSIQSFFERKYGKSGLFNVDSDSLLIAQMQRFLNLFTLLLGVIALISLAVGGIGITNMMLVSVSERIKEIGLRKAVGATDSAIRAQFLTETVVICGIAGMVGLGVGFVSYEGAIWAASKAIEKLQFEWTLDLSASVISLVSILTVGVLSGLIPAMKAEKLQIIEALRSVE